MNARHAKRHPGRHARRRSPRTRVERLAYAATVAVVASVAVPSGLAAAAEVTVRPGDTLSGIAAEHGTTWQKIHAANRDKIADPDLIFPGQVLTISGSSGSSGSNRRRLVAASHHHGAGPSSGVWARLAECESGGDWSINTGNGYFGGLQFSLDSWRAVGGTGFPHHASPGEQIARAERLQAIQGWGAWPACSRKIGLR